MILFMNRVPRKHMEYHPLAQQKAGRHMEPFVIDINPEDNPEFKLSAHEGEEFIYVMNGEVEIEYGKEKSFLAVRGTSRINLRTMRESTSFFSSCLCLIW